MFKWPFLRRFSRQRWHWLLAVALLSAGLARFGRPEEAVRVTFFDVGQGDGIHIRGLAGFDLVVDGGPSNRFADQLARELPAGDRTIELVVATHPHADHLTGLLAVLDRFAVQRVWESSVVHTSRAFERWQELVRQEEALVERPTAGDAVWFPGGSLTVLWPSPQAAIDNLNDASLVLRLDLADGCVLLTGDISETVERQLPTDQIRCEVVKVGHHGSATSSSEEFLRAVSPQLAIISVGPNRYGHPAASTLRRLRDRGARLLRTDLAGTIRLRISQAGQLDVSSKERPARP